MILTVQQKYELDLPALWRELPPASVMENDGWIFEWVDEMTISVECKEDLLESLGYAASFAMGKMTPGRSWVAIIDPARGLVRAMASIVTIDLSDDFFPEYYTVSTPALPVEGAVSWNAQTTDATLAGHPAVVVHEVAAYNFDEDGPVISERYVGTVFPDTSNTVVQLEILAEDLESFADIVATGNAVLGGLRFADPELD